MVDWENLKSQRQWKEALTHLMLNSDRALFKALDVIYGAQTDDEARDRCTKWHNGVGFTASDAYFLTKLHDKRENGRYLHEWEYLELRRRMPKYWKQLMYLSPYYHGGKNVPTPEYDYESMAVRVHVLEPDEIYLLQTSTGCLGYMVGPNGLEVVESIDRSRLPEELYGAPVQASGQPSAQAVSEGVSEVLEPNAVQSPQVQPPLFAYPS